MTQSRTERAVSVPVTFAQKTVNKQQVANHHQPRLELSGLLRDRNVSAVGVVGEIQEKDLGRAFETVAFWDQQPSVGPGALVGWLRRGEWKSPVEARRASFWQSGYYDLLEMVRDLGFDDRLAPMAAGAVLTRGPAPFEVIDAHLRATKPWLYEENTPDKE